MNIINNMSHSIERWEIRERNHLHGEFDIYTGPSWESYDKHIATVTGGLGVTSEGCFESEANAHRIVDCVNACKGLDPEAIPELIKALKKLDFCDERTPRTPSDRILFVARFYDVWNDVKYAIEKVSLQPEHNTEVG